MIGFLFKFNYIIWKIGIGKNKFWDIDIYVSRVIYKSIIKMIVCLVILVKLNSDWIFVI